MIPKNLAMTSFPVGRIFGIEVRIHILFILLVGISTITNLVVHGIVRTAISLLFMLLAFGFVFLHELGHSLVAMFYRIRVRDITLWPLGGIASLESLPQDPQVEIKIAVAGPLVNFVIAILLSPFALLGYLLTHSLFVTYLVAINVSLCVFNLLPAFPMDGGRIYRAWLSRQYSHLDATRRAVKLGQIMAIGLGCLGIFSNVWLILIALFIYLAGQEELAAAQYGVILDRPHGPDGHASPGVFFHTDAHGNRQQFSFHINEQQLAELLRRFFKR